MLLLRLLLPSHDLVRIAIRVLSLLLEPPLRLELLRLDRPLRRVELLLALRVPPRHALAQDLRLHVLARDDAHHLLAAVDTEACPLNLAPTSSTTAALVMGDALAIAILEARGFTAEEFASPTPAEHSANGYCSVLQM